MALFFSAAARALRCNSWQARAALSKSLAGAAPAASWVMSEPYTISALLTPPRLARRPARWACRLVVVSSALLSSRTSCSRQRVPAQLLLLGVGTAAPSSIRHLASDTCRRRPSPTRHRVRAVPPPEPGSLCLTADCWPRPSVPTAGARSSTPTHTRASRCSLRASAVQACSSACCSTRMPPRIALNSPGGTLAHGYTPLSPQKSRRVVPTDATL